MRFVSVEIPIEKIVGVAVGGKSDCVDTESPTLSISLSERFTERRNFDQCAFLCALGFKKDALCIFLGRFIDIEPKTVEMGIASPLLIVGSGKSASLSAYKKGIGAGNEIAILSSMIPQKKVVRMFLHLKDFQFSY